MQRPGLLNERNFYPKSILAKEKIVYTYSKIINCSKFFTPTRKKKQISAQKKMSDAHAKACAKGIIFSNETIFYTHLEKPIFRLKKFLYLPEKKIS